jgi:endonuclease/exonuclease/phosphatase family metal-dependent hydrolase
LYFHDGRACENDSGHVALLLIVHGPHGRIGIANTHLKWDPPETPQAEQYGYRQASELLACLGAIGSPDTPWVICGDFNVEPDSDVVALFNSRGFVDAYGDHEDMFTCAPNRKAKRIDYVFHAGSLASRPLNLRVIADNSSLPSEEEPSDHLAIGASLERCGS